MTGSGAVSWIKKWTEKALLPKADAYVLVSEMQRDYYRLGTKRAVILPNYPEESLFRGYVWQPQLHRNVFTVGYIGTVRNPRELGLLMAAAQLAPNIRVLVAGSRTEQILDYARQFSNVEVRGVFTYPQIPQLYAQIDCVFAMYGEQLNDYYAFPVKVWEALHAGKPVIVLQNSPVGKFVSDNRAGVAVDRSAESVARALIEIRSNYLTYSNRARELGAKLTWESQEGKLLDLYAMLFTKGWPCCWSG
jgi:glycosyltransferase involved in cell wall biosynthesis